MTDHSVYISPSTLINNHRLPCPLSDAARWVRALVLVFASMVALNSPGLAQELSNPTLRLQLGVTADGIPIIKEAVWEATGQVAFRDAGAPADLSAWVPTALIPTTATAPPTWNIIEGDDLTTAEATRELANKMQLTWVVELPKQGQLIRLRVRLTNGGKKARAVDWFPAWSAGWTLGGQAQWARWWQALEYNRVEQTLSSSSQIRLGSRLHSSDDAASGVNPYWVIGGQTSRIYFALQWSGGWNAKLNGLDDGFTFAVRLPSEETELVLNKHETIEGPALLVAPMAGTDDADDRMLWMRQRQSFGQLLYSGPPPSYPLIYNTWYAVRQQVDDDFLNGQIAAMSPYTFDDFVVDAGWYADGRWKPSKAKFPAGSLTEIFTALKANGINAGLWSAPQYVNQADLAGLALEEPPVANRFFGGYLVDMSTNSFADHLVEHVNGLRNRYSVDYWKYDQAFFTEQSRAGAMRNVIGFQSALQAVRQANPDLEIENCQSGGRMINDFTLLATQTSWLRDNRINGLDNSKSNISTALNALEFIFPWAALRFTINMEEIAADDDELTRLYCRSAMAGRWGISTDLSLIGARQQDVIVKEIEHYRWLNHLKYSCVYDLQLPGDQADVAGVTFYGGRRYHAGVLLYRWQRTGAFDQRVVLSKLKPGLTYHVVDADTGTEVTASGSALINNGITVPFSSGRLSAMLLIEAVTQPPTP